MEWQIEQQKLANARQELAALKAAAAERAPTQEPAGDPGESLVKSTATIAST